MTPSRCLPTVAVWIGITLAPSGANAGASALVPDETLREARQPSRLPLSFEANLGQTDAQVRFLSRGAAHTLFLTPAEVVLVMAVPETEQATAVRMKLLGANTRPELAGVAELAGKSHYLLGSDRKAWRTNVPQYARVEYREVYPGVDLVFYGNQGELEYDFVVAPGADPRAIRLGFEGAAGAAIDGRGNLVLTTDAGAVVHRAPVVYQEADGGRKPLEGRYVLEGRDVRFEIPEYDRSRRLYIDPALIYSTYLGGGGGDYGRGIAVDAVDAVYVAGLTASLNFPTAGSPLQGTRSGATDAFVAKLNPAGNAFVYSTYLGGGADEVGFAIAVDSGGGAVVVGQTSSDDFPTQSPYQGTRAGARDAFVAWLDATGSSLTYSTYLGGSLDDIAQGVALDASDAAYVAGQTLSGDLPTTSPSNSPFQAIYGGDRDAFVAKLDPGAGGPGSLIYSTYLGGSDFEVGFAVAVDASGDAYVTGQTQSGAPPETAFPTTLNAFQGACGCFADVFITRLDGNGENLVYSTYLGDTGADIGFGIAVNGTSAFVTGYTDSASFPTKNAFDSTQNGGPDDAFVAQIDTSLSGATSLIYSTFLGGSANDYGRGISADSSGRAWVVGQTASTDFPTQGPLQASSGGLNDVFVTELDASGALLFSTYLGGASNDIGNAIATASTGLSALITGQTQSTNFPLAGSPPQGVSGGSWDAFIAKLPSFIVVTVPNSALNWGIGSTQTVTWNHNLGLGSNVKIDLSRNGGATFTECVSGGVYPACSAVPNAGPTTGSFNWTVTGPATNGARIRVTSNETPAVADTSDVNFTIAAAKITVTSPNTNVKWVIGSTQTITWTSNLQPSLNVLIELDRLYDGTFDPTDVIAASTPNTGSYPWTVTAPVSTTARVRVSVLGSPSASDISNANFQIVNPSITVTTPNSNVLWGIGSLQTIRWNHNLGTGESVTILLSRDSGATFTECVSGGAFPACAAIPNSGATTGTFNWLVTGPAVTTARIRVERVTTPTTSDDSNVDFRIAAPFITVTRPNTNLTFVIGTTELIRWSHDLGTLEYARIEISRDGGVTFDASPIALAVLNNGPTSGVFSWVVSGPSTIQARIRIRWVDSLGNDKPGVLCNAGPGCDIGNVNFTIP